MAIKLLLEAIWHAKDDIKIFSFYFCWFLLRKNDEWEFYFNKNVFMSLYLNYQNAFNMIYFPKYLKYFKLKNLLFHS